MYWWELRYIIFVQIIMFPNAIKHILTSWIQDFSTTDEWLAISKLTKQYTKHACMNSVRMHLWLSRSSLSVEPSPPLLPCETHLQLVSSWLCSSYWFLFLFPSLVSSVFFLSPFCPSPSIPFICYFLICSRMAPLSAKANSFSLPSENQNPNFSSEFRLATT